MFHFIAKIFTKQDHSAAKDITVEVPSKEEQIALKIETLRLANSQSSFTHRARENIEKKWKRKKEKMRRRKEEKKARKERRRQEKLRRKAERKANGVHGWKAMVEHYKNRRERRRLEKNSMYQSECDENIPDRVPASNNCDISPINPFFAKLKKERKARKSKISSRFHKKNSKAKKDRIKDIPEMYIDRLFRRGERMSKNCGDDCINHVATFFRNFVSQNDSKMVSHDEESALKSKDNYDGLKQVFKSKDLHSTIEASTRASTPLSEIVKTPICKQDKFVNSEPDEKAALGTKKDTIVAEDTIHVNNSHPYSMEPEEPSDDNYVFEHLMDDTSVSPVQKLITYLESKIAEIPGYPEETTPESDAETSDSSEPEEHTRPLFAPVQSAAPTPTEHDEFECDSSSEFEPAGDYTHLADPCISTVPEENINIQSTTITGENTDNDPPEFELKARESIESNIHPTLLKLNSYSLWKPLDVHEPETPIRPMVGREYQEPSFDCVENSSDLFDLSSEPENKSHVHHTTRHERFDMLRKSSLIPINGNTTKHKSKSLAQPDEEVKTMVENDCAEGSENILVSAEQVVLPIEPSTKGQPLPNLEQEPALKYKKEETSTFEDETVSEPALDSKEFNGTEEIKSVVPVETIPDPVDSIPESTKIIESHDVETIKKEEIEAKEVVKSPEVAAPAEFEVIPCDVEPLEAEEVKAEELVNSTEVAKTVKVEEETDAMESVEITPESVQTTSIVEPMEEPEVEKAAIEIDAANSSVAENLQSDASSAYGNEALVIPETKPMQERKETYSLSNGTNTIPQLDIPTCLSVESSTTKPDEDVEVEEVKSEVNEPETKSMDIESTTLDSKVEIQPITVPEPDVSNSKSEFDFEDRVKAEPNRMVNNDHIVEQKEDLEGIDIVLVERRNALRDSVEELVGHPLPHLSEEQRLGEPQPQHYSEDLLHCGNKILVNQFIKMDHEVAVAHQTATTKEEEPAFHSEIGADLIAERDQTLNAVEKMAGHTITRPVFGDITFGVGFDDACQCYNIADVKNIDSQLVEQLLELDRQVAVREMQSSLQACRDIEAESKPPTKRYDSDGAFIKTDDGMDNLFDNRQPQVEKHTDTINRKTADDDSEILTNMNNMVRLDTISVHDDWWETIGASISNAGKQVSNMPSMKMPKMSMPKMSMPKMSMPKISLPKINLPNMSMPKMTVSNKQTAKKEQQAKPIFVPDLQRPAPTKAKSGSVQGAKYMKNAWGSFRKALNINN